MTDLIDDNFIIGEPIHLGLTTVTQSTGTNNYYIYVQNLAMATWTITHAFNRPPSVTVINSNGFAIITDIEYPDNNTVVLTFAQPQTGKALLV